MEVRGNAREAIQQLTEEGYIDQQNIQNNPIHRALHKPSVMLPTMIAGRALPKMLYMHSMNQAASPDSIPMSPAGAEHVATTQGTSDVLFHGLTGSQIAGGLTLAAMPLLAYYDQKNMKKTIHESKLFKTLLHESGHTFGARDALGSGLRTVRNVGTTASHLYLGGLGASMLAGVNPATAMGYLSPLMALSMMRTPLGALAAMKGISAVGLMGKGALSTGLASLPSMALQGVGGAISGVGSLIPGVAKAAAVVGGGISGAGTALASAPLLGPMAGMLMMATLGPKISKMMQNISDKALGKNEVKFGNKSVTIRAFGADELMRKGNHHQVFLNMVRMYSAIPGTFSPYESLALQMYLRQLDYSGGILEAFRELLGMSDLHRTGSNIGVENTQALLKQTGKGSETPTLASRPGGNGIPEHITGVERGLMIARQKIGRGFEFLENASTIASIVSNIPGYLLGGKNNPLKQLLEYRKEKTRGEAKQAFSRVLGVSMAATEALHKSASAIARSAGESFEGQMISLTMASLTVLQTIGFKVIDIARKMGINAENTSELAVSRAEETVEELSKQRTLTQRITQGTLKGLSYVPGMSLIAAPLYGLTHLFGSRDQNPRELMEQRGEQLIEEETSGNNAVELNPQTTLLSKILTQVKKIRKECCKGKPRKNISPIVSDDTLQEMQKQKDYVKKKRQREKIIAKTIVSIDKRLKRCYACHDLKQDMKRLIKAIKKGGTGSRNPFLSGILGGLAATLGLWLLKHLKNLFKFLGKNAWKLIKSTFGLLLKGVKAIPWKSIGTTLLDGFTGLIRMVGSRILGPLSLVAAGVIAASEGVKYGIEMLKEAYKNKPFNPERQKAIKDKRQEMVRARIEEQAKRQLKNPSAGELTWVNNPNVHNATHGDLIFRKHDGTTLKFDHGRWQNYTQPQVQVKTNVVSPKISRVIVPGTKDNTSSPQSADLKIKKATGTRSTPILTQVQKVTYQNLDTLASGDKELERVLKQIKMIMAGQDGKNDKLIDTISELKAITAVLTQESLKLNGQSAARLNEIAEGIKNLTIVTASGADSTKSALSSAVENAGSLSHQKPILGKH
jgi:hypothetical protein